jgi:hypothetical protein
MMQQQVPVGIQQQQGVAGAAPRPKKQKKKKVAPVVEVQRGSSQGQGVHGFLQASQ